MFAGIPAMTRAGEIANDVMKDHDAAAKGEEEE
jgi:4-carboxymuconolactone decarboxylase